MHRRSFLSAVIAFPAAARAHSFRRGAIAIGHSWALPAAHGDGQLFFPMVNNGAAADALIAARSAICASIELRRNNRYDDPALEAIALEPGKPVPMRPTARHLRLVSLRQPLKIGGRFTVILDFLNAGEVEIEAMVEEAASD